MRKIPQPPLWQDRLSKNPSKLIEMMNSQDANKWVSVAQVNYDYWDKVAHYPIESPEDFWMYLKFTRSSSREQTAVRAKDGGHFSYMISKTMLQKLSFIDSYGSGLMLSEENKSMSTQKDQLILSGITEEAIASSQIEGANTSRKVAKEMILSKRKPQTHGEQMIINNFNAMQQISVWKDLPLSVDMIMNLQEIITSETLEFSSDSGRLREDEDNVSVVDSLTQEVVFVPPKKAFVEEDLQKLVDFANEKETNENYIHPVIKACIIHFWLAYLHPFVDGNGRTARALFYWYLLSRDYWLFKYLSVSRIILNSKSQYDDAYLYSEYDSNDLTYFIYYKLHTIVKSINEFIVYYKKKMEEGKKISALISIAPHLNTRQIKVIRNALKSPNKTFSISYHQIVNQISYETARQDLMFLAEEGYLILTRKGKKQVYLPCIDKIKEIL